MVNQVEVWVLHPSRTILITDFPGPPAEICGYVSGEAQEAAKARGYATVSEIGFPSECYLGAFPERDNGWSKAREVAQAKATELGYKIESSSMWDCYDEEDEYLLEIDPDEYDEDEW